MAVAIPVATSELNFTYSGGGKHADKEGLGDIALTPLTLGWHGGQCGLTWPISVMRSGAHSSETIRYAPSWVILLVAPADLYLETTLPMGKADLVRHDLLHGDPVNRFTFTGRNAVDDRQAVGSVLVVGDAAHRDPGASGYGERW